MIGMLSKAKGQVLRVAAALHVLSGDCEDDEGKIVMSDTIADTISEDTLLAAKNFVITCCQHAAYVGVGFRRRKRWSNQWTSNILLEAISECVASPEKVSQPWEQSCNRGNKAAALAAMHELEAAGIGELEKKESRRGTSAVSTMSVVWKITVIFMCGSAS